MAIARAAARSASSRTDCRVTLLVVLDAAAMVS
jgi:hypothetical protein